METPSQKFDRQLFALKLSELSNEMQAQSVMSDREASSEARKLGGSRLLNIVDSQLALLREWGQGIDRICREVWQIQGEAVTPEFVRNVLVPEAMSLIEARKGVVMSNIELTALRTRDISLQPAQRHLVMEINALKSKVGTKYEIEARTLEHKNATSAGITQAGAPPQEVVGRGVTGHENSTAKSTQVPPNPPMYFPTDLWPETNVILLEAQRKFPWRAQTVELCRHVAAEMTRIFCEAVRVGKIKAGSVLSEGGGGMEDLLHSLLVYNDDEPKSGFSSLSDKAHQLGKEVRQSDEWLALAKAIAEVQHSGTGAGRHTVSFDLGEHNRNATLAKKARIAEIERTLNRPPTTEYRGQRVHGGQGWRQRLEEERQHLLIAVAELERDVERRGSSHAHSSGKTAQSAGSKSSNATTVIGQNIDRLRKECGWSLTKLAEETGIDKKSIISHVNKGTRPVPRLLREYAQAFSKALGRTIIAPDLEK